MRLLRFFEEDVVDNYNTRFATVSFCQLLHWFGIQLEDFWEDFDIYSYKVSNIIVGNSGNQCVFNTKDIIEKVKINL